MRRAYLALAWRPGDADAADRARDIGLRVAAETGWRAQPAFPGLALWTDPAQPLPVRPTPGAPGVLLGEVFPMPGAEPGLSPLAPGPVRTREVVARMSRALWGRYVALLQAPDGVLAVYRDPSGSLDAMTWDLGDGLFVVASDMVRAPRWLRPRRQGLNWDRIGRMLAVPYASTSTPLFDDIDVVAPGQMLAVGAGGSRAEAIWSPAAFTSPGPQDLREMQAELVRRLDACTAALVRGHEKVLVELSGGLDSSILAGALAASGETGRVAAWLNYRGDRAEGDETRYAGDVARRIGVELTTIRKPMVPIDEASLAELAYEFWPAMAGVDVGRDRQEAELLRQTGATAIVSGQGGDGVYFQPPTAMVAADEFRRHGWRALASPVLPAVARRTRQSVWGVLAEVRRARRGAERRLTYWSGILSRDLQAEVRRIDHPWVREAREQGLPPGKVLHIHGVAATHLYNGRSRRRRLADLLYPHFAQPVMELCLGVPVPDLAGASYDRPFARQAFCERLPPSVVARRSKGNLTAYFAHLVAASAETLRPYLLDGCLCEAGVLDRAALEAHLDPDRLIWRGAPTDVLWATVTEAWVRYWQTQVPDSLSAVRRLSA
jgi:asparagine synthase (glutamine-hydrolysing)